MHAAHSNASTQQQKRVFPLNQAHTKPWRSIPQLSAGEKNSRATISAQNVCSIAGRLCKAALQQLHAPTPPHFEATCKHTNTSSRPSSSPTEARQQPHQAAQHYQHVPAKPLLCMQAYAADTASSLATRALSSNSTAAHATTDTLCNSTAHPAADNPKQLHIPCWVLPQPGRQHTKQQPNCSHTTIQATQSSCQTDHSCEA